MDLNVHRAIVRLALDRLRAGPRAREYIVPPEALAARLFYPLWLGNWLTDMNQASAFFDVVEGKYRDPYQRWRSNGNYELPEGIATHATEWLRTFGTLWAKECDAVATLRDFQDLKPPEGLCIPDANAIGGYYPLDHFDVADRLAPVCGACNQLMEMTADQSEWRCPGGHSRRPAGDLGGCKLEAVPDSFEYDRASDRLSYTVRRGVFTDCHWGPLYAALQGDRTRHANLRYLGKALHILQDFFAHTNFTELLLQCARGLPPALDEALRLERTGSFASFIQGGDPATTTVVSGRFDQLDTVASILKIYRENLIPRWSDLDAGGYRGQRGQARDLMVEVLFGTFSNQPFAAEALDAVKTALAVGDWFSALGDRVTRGVTRFFAGVASAIEPEAARGIDTLKDLVLAASDVEARDYAKAGRILYVERAIEKCLEDKLARDRRELGPRVLPHHTLLAKDQDTSQPECRLVFKLSCLLATDLTAEVLELFLTGAGHKSFEELLARRIAHPMVLLGDNPRTEAALQRVVPRIYGERWWQAGQSPGNLLLQ